MNWQMISKRGLQVFCVLSAVVAIAGGGTFVLMGADGLARVVGVEYPILAGDVETAVTSIDGSVQAVFDVWFRALGWYWFMTGVMLFWILPKIDTHTAWFRFIHVGFMAVGVATAFTISELGPNFHTRYDALVPEFGIPLLAIVWQHFVARSAEPLT